MPAMHVYQIPLNIRAPFAPLAVRRGPDGEYLVCALFEFQYTHVPSVDGFLCVQASSSTLHARPGVVGRMSRFFGTTLGSRMGGIPISQSLACEAAVGMCVCI